MSQFRSLVSIVQPLIDVLFDDTGRDIKVDTVVAFFSAMPMVHRLWTRYQKRHAPPKPKPERPPRRPQEAPGDDD